MCLIADSLPILRAMVGDTIVEPAPPAITDGELIQLIRASVMMHGINCVTVIQDGASWIFSPCPPNADTLAYMLQGAASIRLGAETPVSYRTRAISVSQHPQGLADMRRYANELMVNIEARGNVCNPNGAVAGELISVTLDLVTQVYPFCADACGNLYTGREIQGSTPGAPTYAAQVLSARTAVPAGVDAVTVTPPTGKTLTAFIPGSAALEWVGPGAPYSLGLTGSHVINTNAQTITFHLLSQAATGDYVLVTQWQ